MQKKELLKCQLCRKNFFDLKICLVCMSTLCEDCNLFHHKQFEQRHNTVFLKKQIQKKTKNNLQIFIFCQEIQRCYFLDSNTQKSQISRKIFEYIILQTQKGKCLTSFKKIQKYILNGNNQINKNDVFNCINEESKRAFGKKNPEKLLSLNIQTISIQLISFILKSVALHKMEPNHILIHSRIKEYFGIKIKMKDWKKFVDNLYTNTNMQAEIQKVSHLFQGFKVVPNNEGNLLFEPFDFSWEYLDVKQIEQNDPDYKVYLNCMQDFFQKENSENFQFLTENPERWNISSDFKDEQKKSLLDLLKEKKIDKAIPGGKYGCGLLLKKMYSKELKNIKLGKIVRMIKRSLKEQIYIHEKTLIYKNNKEIDINEETRLQKIADIKQTIINQLEIAKNSGISLSQLPQLIRDSLGFQPDFEQLGFPKLKQFIETIENVFIQKNSENHISIKLKKYTTWQEETCPNQYNSKGKNSYKSRQSRKSFAQNNQKRRKFGIAKKTPTIASDLSQNEWGSYNDLSDDNYRSDFNYKLADKKLIKVQESKFKLNPLESQKDIDRNLNFIKYLKIILKKSEKPMPVEALKYNIQQMFLENNFQFNFSDKQFNHQLSQLDGKLVRIQEGKMESEYYSSPRQLVTLISHKGQSLRKKSMAYSDQNCLDRSDSFKQTNQTSKEQFNLWSGNSTPKHALTKRSNFTYFSDMEKPEQIPSLDSSSQGLQDQQSQVGQSEIVPQKNIEIRKSSLKNQTKYKSQYLSDYHVPFFPNFPFRSYYNQIIMFNNLSEQFIQEQRNPQEQIELDDGIKKLLEQFKKEIDKNFIPALDRVDENNLGGVEKCLMIFFNILFFIFILPIFCGFFQIEPNEIVVIETFGKPIKVMQKPGLNWYFPIGTKFRKVKKSLQTEEIFGSSVPDMYGSPLNVSVVITYTISNALANIYNIANSTKYLHSQAMEVVRRVVSQFKYRSNNPNEHTLIKDSMIIGKYMKELLNIKLQIAGVIVTRMELMEISYHTEIAQGMLQIQQAQAKVEARQEIVKGGVLIVKDALIQLEEQKVDLENDTKQKLTKDLMIVVCSDFGKPQPVLNI